MHRLGKEGFGAAYLAGFEWGINAGYDVLVEMDADGSHQPGSAETAGGAHPMLILFWDRVGSKVARWSIGRNP